MSRYGVSVEQFKAQGYTYEQFINVSKSWVKNPNNEARIVTKNFKLNTLTMKVLDNMTPGIDITDFVLDIVQNGMGYCSNPSELRNWKGWN